MLAIGGEQGSANPIKNILKKRASMDKSSPAFSPNPIIKERYGHLFEDDRSKEQNQFNAFLYQALDPNKQDRNVNLTSNFMPDELQLVTAGLELPIATSPSGGFASLRPNTRKEVLLLRHAMDTMLNRIGLSSAEDYPTEMHTLLAIIQEEQKVYDMVFREIIRQVSIHMHERGQILSDLRERYMKMFNKIPKQVRSLHTELIAQRKLNRRLSEELVKSRDNMGELLRELEQVRRHDQEVTRQAQDAQQKLVAILTQSDTTDEILEEYHKLYRMQRDRLDENSKTMDRERKMWMDAATNLALRIGVEHGLTEISDLYRFEHTRLRAVNHIIVHISAKNELDVQELEKRVGVWRSRVLKISQRVTDEDKMNIEVLAKVQKLMREVIVSLGDAEEEIVTDFPALAAFELRDVKGVGEALLSWTQQITSVATRFTSDHDLGYREEIKQLRQVTDGWIDFSYSIFSRLEKTSKAKEYVSLNEFIAPMHVEVEEWLKRLDMRVAGEDGIAGLIISLQNQLEDTYTSYSVRDYDKALISTEKATLKGKIEEWEHQVSAVISILSETFEREQSKVPLTIENWISRILDRLNTDTDIRNDESMKLHNSIISWLVQFLVKNDKPLEIDVDLQHLHQEIRVFNSVLMKDADDLELSSDEQTDLRKILMNSSESWMLISKKLVRTELKEINFELKQEKLIRPKSNNKISDNSNLKPSASFATDNSSIRSSDTESDLPKRRDKKHEKIEDKKHDKTEEKSRDKTEEKKLDKIEDKKFTQHEPLLHADLGSRRSSNSSRRSSMNNDASPMFDRNERRISQSLAEEKEVNFIASERMPSAGTERRMSYNRRHSVTVASSRLGSPQ
ncbi:hypothetical protein O9G_004998 [Rozella allomycis CSF55]|uniref:Uncharacterized protein n=1 Tax=Rozella allomycis (strain CSF55) TaxID=988480 RepID=A0A075AX89_ROZAC|nr:hypothetical protein O9G_004998 [Rozella allomycis CSF55]|eukprot:EPZ33129.1 hypothetical protein O9G_004998 [Rozella allomycis CSF55]